MAQTRTERRKKTKQNASSPTEAEKEQHDAATRIEKRKKNTAKSRARFIPIWLRLIIVVVLLAVSLVAGAVVGYSVMGSGSPGDVFHKKTWQHPFNVVFSDKEE